MGVGLEALGDEFQCIVVVTAVDELVDHAGHLAIVEKDRRRVRIDERGASRKRCGRHQSAAGGNERRTNERKHSGHWVEFVSLTPAS